MSTLASCPGDPGKDAMWSEVEVVNKAPFGNLGVALSSLIQGGGVSAKCEVMPFCLKLATSKKGGGFYPFCAQIFFPKRAAGGYLGCAQVRICPFFGHAEGNFGVSCSKVMDLCTLT